MGYGYVKSKEIPCGKFTLNTTTTKYKRNSEYEFVRNTSDGSVRAWDGLD